MATGVDMGVDMGICVPGNNGVNTVVAAWSTLPKLCLLGGTLVDPVFAQGRARYTKLENCLGAPIYIDRLVVVFSK
jgi:hypothetical protein